MSVHNIMKPAVTLVAILVLGCLGSQTEAKADERYNARIIGGEDVTPAEQTVVCVLNPDTQAQCIGTRIKPQWVLTAVNCNTGSVKGYIIVTLGKDKEQQTNHTVIWWINHKKYKNMKYWDNNIALVKVEPNTEAANVATLVVTEDADYINKTGTAFGWGASCGDNGSPLIINNVIVGITSWIRYPCASLPAVYTKLSHYINWISHTVKHTHG